MKAGLEYRPDLACLQAPSVKAMARGPRMAKNATVANARIAMKERFMTAANVVLTGALQRVRSS